MQCFVFPIYQKCNQENSDGDSKEKKSVIWVRVKITWYTTTNPALVNHELLNICLTPCYDKVRSLFSSSFWKQHFLEVEKIGIW